MAKSGRKSPEVAGSGKDDLLSLALAQGMNQAEAGLYAGVSERTVRRRLADPAFVALLNRTRGRLVSEAVGKLAASGNPAAERMRALLDSDDEHIQLGAARAIMTQLVKLGTWGDMLARLEALEARVKEPGDPARPRLIIPDHDDRWGIADKGDDRG